MSIKDGFKDRRIAECRQCQTPVMENLEGVVTERSISSKVCVVKGWCSTCMEEAMPLMAHVSEVATGDLDFEDFIDIMSTKPRKQLYTSANLNISEDSEKYCPCCGDSIIHGSFFDACRKCSPKYFEKCKTCSQLKVNCLCNWEDTVL